MTSVADQSQPSPPLIEIDQTQLQQHVGEVVRESVEETLNLLLDAEAEELVYGMAHYETRHFQVT